MNTENINTQSSEYREGVLDGITDFQRQMGGRQLPMNANYRAGYAVGFNSTLQDPR